MEVTAQAGAAAPVVQLSAKERKAAREAARRLVMKQEAERIAAARGEAPDQGEAAPKGDAAPAAPAPAPLASHPDRTDEHRAADAAAFLSGVLFPALALLAPWFSPWALDLARFTDAQAVEDGRAWAGVLRRYPWADRLVVWSAPFARVVQRLRALAVPKPTPPAEERAA